MGKYRIRLKIQGFELEVDGEREDIPAITTALKHQIAGMMIPAQIAAAGAGTSDNESPKTIEADGKPLTRPNRKRPNARSDAAASPIEFQHDSSKYGDPLQNWTVTEKSIWLLYVIKEITGTKEVNGPQLAATFNQYFKQAKRLHPPNVTRDLGKLKGQDPAPIGEDKSMFYLTHEGDRQAKQLVQSVLTPAAS